MINPEKAERWKIRWCSLYNLSPDNEDNLKAAQEAMDNLRNLWKDAGVIK